MLLFQGIEKINRVVGQVSALMLGILEIIVVSEVVMRYVFNNPSVWSFPVTKMFFGANFMMAMAYTLLYKSHVIVDIVYSRFNHKTQRILDLIGYLIFFFPFVTIVILHSYQYALKSWIQAETTFDACMLPLYPIKTVIPIAFLLLFLQGIVVVGKVIIELRNKRGL